MRRTPEQVSQVELVEDDHDLGAPRSGQGWVAVGGRLRPYRWHALAVVLVVALVVGGLAWRSQARRTAVLAAQHGLAASLAASLSPAWHADATLVGFTDDALIVTADGELRALDEETGTVRWAVATPASCAATRDAHPRPDPVALVLCTEPGHRAPEDGVYTAGVPAGFSGGRLVVVDAATGSIVHERDVTWPLWQAALVEGDLVVAGVDTDGRLVAERQDLRSGTAVWAYADEPRDSGALTAFTSALVVEPGVLTLDAGVERRRLDPATGAELADDAVEHRGTTDLRDGRVAVWEYEPTAEGWAGSRVRFDVDGEEVAVTGVARLEPAADDGSVPGLLVAYDLDSPGDHLLIDTTTGDHLTVGASGIGPLVDGTLVTFDELGVLVAYDARTGAELWRHSDASILDPGRVPLTDGERLLVLETSPSQLLALDPATGEVLWSAPWARTDGNQLAVTPSGQVLAVAGDRITALAP